MVVNTKFEPGDIVWCTENERYSGKHFGNIYTVKRISFNTHIDYHLVGNYNEEIILPEHELSLVCRKEDVHGETAPQQ